MIALLPVLAAAAVLPTPATVPVLAHSVERGALLAAADFELQPRGPGFAIGALAPTDAAGREAARDLAAGAVVRRGDVVAPRLVRRGEPVAISWRSAGLVIATTGRALAAGGLGEPVRVVATGTNRTLDGIVEGAGSVAIGAGR